ncbi:enolase C-terminal domain-like protein [Bifidobacterium sp. ESL0784]|uniref:enolase C-terminal domain-like protein n=1 Tax=Bifidobacterium sp. ESL0784 TaxID=2983231 RepID=UPI0023FA22B6|nr:enolase C-terminal domain-like protein [Bifidobacterium sp. ESL0784]MDF7640373.1 enolase C-terminal domain-like protein [Bifidobacterium sp. ESL0784]
MVPKIETMEVIPVAGYDSMLLNLSGAHSPFFTRNIVIMTDTDGYTGISEVPGTKKVTDVLNEVKPMVIGQPLSQWKNIVRNIHDKYASLDAGGRGNQTFDLRTTVHVQTAVETPMLDLLGKHMEVPVAALLGDGQVRDHVRFLSYLFYVGDRTKTDLPYIHDDDNSDEWGRIRREPALDPDAIVAQAKATTERYGFHDFKLKGGVFEGKEEIKAIKALKKAFPDARITLDPNQGWSLEEAIDLCNDMTGILTYVEDPCGAEGRFSARETMAEFHRITGLPTATNMCDTDWREMKAAIRLDSVTIPLADPHFWTMEGCVRVAQLCHDMDLTWGVHSNNHFDISLAMVAQSAAAAPGKLNACDTHYIWQDGQYLTKNPPKIENGEIEVRRDVPGLGIEVDRDAVEKAHKLYVDNDCGTRDDAVGMQYLIPGWKFDPHRPSMVR